MFVVKHKKIFFIISAILVIASLASIFIYGLNLGIDFKGGSILEVSYPKNDLMIEVDSEDAMVEAIATRPELAKVQTAAEEALLGEVLIQPTGENGFIVRIEGSSEEDRASILGALSLGGEYTVHEERFNSIGPTIGAELRSKAWIAIVTVIVAIILFIAYVFRHVSYPVSSWKYGVIAIIALAHDVIIPTGIFAYLGYEIDSLFVIALLAIIGLSVNDTIVVFDRVRENIRLKISKDFNITVGKSLKQTVVRSINTSLTTLIVLLTLYLIGPESTKNFSFALALGIFFGTYSSIFLASPLLTVASSIKNR